MLRYLRSSFAFISIALMFAPNLYGQKVADESADQAPRPNILWLCPDGQRWDTIRSLGNPHIRTPNLDRLVATGVAFERAYCQSPICSPSRAAFLTGRYPFATGVLGNGQEFFPSDERLITRTLADVGYDCALVGKLHLSAIRERLGDGTQRNRIEPRPDDGYRVFHWDHHPGFEVRGHREYLDWVNAHGQDFRELRARGDVPTHLHQSAWCAEKAIEFIRDAQSPWLLSFNSFHPHGPLDLPADWTEWFDVDSVPGPAFQESDLAMQNEYLKGVDFVHRPIAARRPDEWNLAVLEGDQRGISRIAGHPMKIYQAAYWATIELVDRQIGRILDVLEETGQLENTIVIYHSDHGYPIGDHGLIGAGCRFYEGFVHMPFIISWPGHFREGLRAKGLVELIDVAPTLLDVLDLPIPDNMHGQSLVPVLSGAGDPDRIKEGVRSEWYYSYEDYQSKSSERPPLKRTYATMYRTERYKLVVYHGLEIGELYDMQADPNEFQNLWDSPRHIDVKLRLLKASFDHSMRSIDRGPRRVGSA